MFIELTPEQRENLMVFLERVNLTGKEVPAYLQIIKAVQEAKVPEPKKVEE